MAAAEDSAVTAALQTGLRYLTACQSLDGSFLGQASLKPQDFLDAQSHDTSFFTSLIVTSLRQLPAAAGICQRAATFIDSQRSAESSWNYWRRDSADFRQRPYPDDLDDTALALTALTTTDKYLVSGQTLGALGRLLISQETQLGGPYRTWLVSSEADATWRDVDVAVNANIGFLLKLHDVEAPGLMNFLTEALQNNQISSRYYDSALPVLFFISRWYKGPARDELQKLINRYSRQIKTTNALHLSLCLGASYYAGLPPAAHLKEQLLGLQQADGSWPAASLYFEPPINNQAYYAGSAALTTAFALEALVLAQAQTRAARDAPQAAVTSTVTQPAIETLQAHHLQHLRRVKQKDQQGQIKAIATITAAACGQIVDPSILFELNQASLNGWASYTLFDDILDHDSDASQLSQAMLGLRRASWHFQQALPANHEFQKFVQSTLDIVDAANYWEQQQARAVVAVENITISTLPNYRKLKQLAERSLGHCLASTGVLVALGQPVQHADQKALRQFYCHYLIARQLHDDAHDWQSDLEKGQLSAVVSRLLADYYGSDCAITITLAIDLPSLKVCFWETTIEWVLETITQHLKMARQALADCRIIIQPMVLTSWLDDLATTADQVTTGKANARDFMAAFSAS